MSILGHRSWCCAILLLLVQPGVWLKSRAIADPSDAKRRSEIPDPLVENGPPVNPLLEELQQLDYWITRHDGPEGGTYQDLAIPAGFFGPGCDAFEGRARFKGCSIDPAAMGDVDTVLQRSAAPVLPDDPVGTTRTVSLELRELCLVSTEPICVTCNGTTEFWTINVGLSPTAPPTGQLTASKTHEKGGVFDSAFYVQPLLTFTNVTDPDRVLVLDTAGVSAPVELTSRAAPFVSHSHALFGRREARYAISPEPPSPLQSADRIARFAPGIAAPLPNDRSSQGAAAVLHSAPGHQHCVNPPYDLIPAGEDWFCTIPEETYDTVQIPAGFFGTGSDSLDAEVSFERDAAYPFDTHDTIIRRLDPVLLPLAPGSEATTRIMITDAALQGQTPVEVTFDNGSSSIFFNVRARLSSLPQSEGTMIIKRECAEGGTYEASLPVLVAWIFNEVGNPENEFVFDTGIAQQPPMVLEGTDEVWCRNPPLRAPPGNGFYPTCYECGTRSARPTVLRTQPEKYDRSAQCTAQRAAHACMRAQDGVECEQVGEPIVPRPVDAAHQTSGEVTSE